MGKRKSSHTVGRNANWYSLFGERCESSLKIELRYHPAISPLSIYPEETIIQKYVCTTMFITALFAVARTCKHLKRPSTEE